MRKIISTTFLTMDGVMQAPGGPEEDKSTGFTWGGWQAPIKHDPELDKILVTFFTRPFELLLGRVTYDIFAAYWPTAKTDNEVAVPFNATKKYVVSHDANFKATWNNSTVISGDLPAPRSGLFFVYVILCDDDSMYIGQTDDLKKRWEEHVSGKGAEHTKKHKPISIIHYEELNSREEAVKREQDLKTGFGRKWLKREYKAGRTRQAGVLAELKKLKAMDGPDLIVWGSGNLIQTLMKEQLVDQMSVWIHPVTIGTGKRLFADGTPPATWTLVDSKVGTNGVIFAAYEPAEELKTGRVGE